MDKDKPFNFFGRSRKLQGKTPKTEPEKKEDESKIPSQENVQEMIEKMKRLHDELNRKLDATYQRSGWSHNHIRKFLENPNNFKKEEWEKTQQQRQELLASIWQKLGKGNIEQITKMQKAKEINQAAKDRKSKTLGARRNWIPMK